MPLTSYVSLIRVPRSSSQFATCSRHNAQLPSLFPPKSPGEQPLTSWLTLPFAAQPLRCDEAAAADKKLKRAVSFDSVKYAPKSALNCALTCHFHYPQGASVAAHAERCKLRGCEQQQQATAAASSKQQQQQAAASSKQQQQQAASSKQQQQQAAAASSSSSSVELQLPSPELLCLSPCRR